MKLNMPSHCWSYLGIALIWYRLRRGRTSDTYGAYPEKTRRCCASDIQRVHRYRLPSSRADKIFQIKTRLRVSSQLSGSASRRVQ